jgi:hypothetical protein
MALGGQAAGELTEVDLRAADGGPVAGGEVEDAHGQTDRAADLYFRSNGR